MFEQEQKEDQQQYPFRMVMPQQMQRDNMIIQTSPEQIGVLLEHELRGESWDDREGKWKKTRKPLMNDEGVDKVITLVKQFLTQNSTLSNISDGMAKAQALAFGNALTDAIAVKAREWELDKAVRSALVIGLVCMIYNVLTRSIGKGAMSDKEMYATTISSQEHTVLKMDNERRGFGSGMLNTLNPFKKK